MGPGEVGENWGLGVGDLTCSGFLCKMGCWNWFHEVLLSNQSIHFLAAVWHSHSDHLSTVEKDTNGEVLWVWCYPSTTATLRNLLLRKCCLTDENKLLHPFVFGQYRRAWFYITTVEVPDSSILKKVWL